MISAFFGLLFVLVFLALVVGLYVLPLVVALRCRGQIAQLRTRIEQLEHQLRSRQDVPVYSASEAIDVEPAEAVSAPPVAVPLEDNPLPELGFLDRLLQSGSGDLETWIGRRGLGWVAVLLLLFATAFFLKYSFENAWVGELGRVMIGVLIGAGLAVGGLLYHRRGWRLFAQMLTAGGVAVLYLATYGAFGYYHLLPTTPAAVFLVLVIAEAAALAVLYEAPAIALMALIGGLLNPVLLRSDHDRYRDLFLYLSALNTGVVCLTLFRPWRGIVTVALVGTQVLFWGWYNANYHPEKLDATIAFEAALFGLFLVQGILAHVVRRRQATVEDLGCLVLNASFFIVAAFVILDPQFHLWMGTLAVVLAAIYTSLAWLIQRRRPEDQRLLLVVVGIALAFLASAFPLQTKAAWIAVGWAVEGAALWWFGLRIRAAALRGMAAVLLLVAVGRLVCVDLPDVGPRGRFVPLLNTFGSPAAVVVFCVFGAAAASRHYLNQLGPVDRAARWLLALAGVGLGWLVLSKETFDFGVVYFNNRGAETSLSGVWAAYAGLLLAIGFRLHSGPLRWSALGLFALTLAKVVFYDMATLPGFYRVGAFLVLALIMAAAARGYQRFQLGRLVGQAEESRNDAI